MANFGISDVSCLKGTGWVPVGYFVCACREGGEGGSLGIFSAASGTTGYVLQWRKTSCDVETGNKKKNLMSGERQIENTKTNQDNCLRQNAV